MDLSPLLYMAVGAVGSLAMWLVLGPAMTGHGVKRLARKAADGDEEAMQFFYDLGNVLIRWAGEPSIKTGEKVKIPTDKHDDEGRPIFKEVDEVLAPIELISRSVGNYAVMHMKGFMGGKKSQMQNQMAEAMAQSGGDIKALIPLALQAATRGDYGPALGIIMQKLLNDDKGILSQGGNKTGW